MRRRDAVMLMAGAYVVTTVIEEFVLFDTLDTMVLALLLGALAAWLRASQSSRRGAWRVAAYALVGLGAAYKLIPIIVLPFLILGDLQTERKWSPVALRAGIAFLVLVAPFAISYRDSGLASLGFLRYHADRGVEIESTWATLMWLAFCCSRRAPPRRSLWLLGVGGAGRIHLFGDRDPRRDPVSGGDGSVGAGVEGAI